MQQKKSKLTFFLVSSYYQDNQERAAINDAMWTMSELIPCVPFGIWPKGSSPTGDYVFVKKGKNNGCASWAGRQGGRQVRYIYLKTQFISFIF